MKVVLVITSADWGGAQRHVYDLARGLCRRGHAPEVWYGVPGPLVARLAQAGIPSRRVANLVRRLAPGRDFAGVRSLRRELLAFGPDVVHVHSSKAGVLVRAALGDGALPVVYTVHGLVWRNERMAGWKRRFYRWVEERLLSRAAVTVVLSAGDEAALVSARPDLRPRIVRIAHGVEGPPRPLGLPDAPILGTVARFTPEKALDRALELVAAVRPALPDVRLVLVGDGPLRGTLVAMAARLGVADCVQFAGFQEDVWPWLESMRVFLLTSVKEGMPYALLEAMAAGRLILATPVGAVPELVASYPRGRVAAPADLARELLALLQAPPAPLEGVQLPDVNAMVEAVLDVYRQAQAVWQGGRA
ncbi:MAG: glycosyltransferase [Firmicutes bacterium]|nr:glycosyltransferase [Alicyclobacillaceae bacterium]MCL6497096.1 glycosyltransferase [Bacillota bacterium]